MTVVYPPYIFGMHDRGGEHLMLTEQRRGWVLVTEALGTDPNNGSGSDYSDLSNQGLGVIARLNHGYGTAGTIPYSNQYDNFARRCGNFAAASPGCNIWAIGNEMNLANERPGGPGGQAITPELYAACYLKCRAEIRRRPGHESDQVLVGAVGPWNIETKYPGNPEGDWIRYFADTLSLLGDAVDGMTLHTYTHGQDPALVFSTAKMNPPFQNYYYHFYAYRNFMDAIPQSLRDRPVYITETDQYQAWRNENTGWVQNAYSEIDRWNQDSDNQPIQALILFRWIIGNPNDPNQVGWAIENKLGVQDDFRAAMDHAYQVVLPPTTGEYVAAWQQVGAPAGMALGAEIQFEVTLRNEGRRTWEHVGPGAVRVGYRWHAPDGSVIPGVLTGLPRNVLPGQTITVSNMKVRSPDVPGFYTLELDLLAGESLWFSELGSPTWEREDFRVGARYRVAWLRVEPPSEGAAEQTVTFPVRVRNEGSLTWPPGGDNPVTLTYKWLDPNHSVVVADGLRTPIGREVPPLDAIDLDARLLFPSEPGAYILQMDMVHEFVVWFHWRGSPVYEAAVTVVPAAPDYAAAWLNYDGPQQLVSGRRGQAYVEVKNTGQQSWPASGDDAVSLGYRWLDANGQEVPISDGQTWPLPRTIQPAGTAVFSDVEFASPVSPGSYRLVWDLQKGGQWLSLQGVAVLERPMQITPPEYAVEWQVLVPWPEWMPPAAEEQVSLRLRNAGTKVWASAGSAPVHLAYTWFSPDGGLVEPWDTFRILLPDDVSPNDSVDLLDITVKTPPVLGTYLLRWDVVEEGQAWFFRRGAAPLEVPVSISDEVLFPAWTADASHNSSQVGQAFDGESSTFWDSKAIQAPDMWFQVDLGRVQVLDRLRALSPGRGFPLGYVLELSEDGSDWQLVASKARNWTNVDVGFPPTRARYLRLRQTGQPSWPASWMISEISIGTTELWAGVEASHYTADAHEAQEARLDIAWNTRAVRQKPGMWFQVDMGGLRDIERVTLDHPANQQPRGYVVRTSVDGQVWREVARDEDNWGQLDVQFSPVTARFVCVELTNSSPYHPWGINQFVIWRSAPGWQVGRRA
ncbi:MAG: discoidin domain-containing protein [Anaerolineae bacterium]|jgi:hypothetical protein